MTSPKNNKNKKQNYSHLKVENNNKDLISRIWNEKILNNWSEFREFILIKETREIINKDNLDLLSKSIQTNKEQIISLWKLGLPNWLRKAMWKTIIQDKCEICDNLYNNYLKRMEGEYESNFQNFHSITFTQRKSISSIYSYNTKVTQNDIIKHIDKLIKKYSNLIHDEEKFKKDIFTLIRCFCLHRPDIIYCHQIAYIATIFYLNSQNTYNAFYSFCNVVIPSYLFKFIIKDEIYIHNFSDFFHQILKKNSPDLNNYFKEIGVNIDYIFHKWIENLFVKTFQYDIVLRIWDNFFLKGEIFVFEVSLAILKILEEEILQLKKSEEIIDLLKIFPVKYNEDSLFDTIDKISISNEYTEYFDSGDLGNEKGELLRDL